MRLCRRPVRRTLPTRAIQQRACTRTQTARASTPTQATPRARWAAFDARHEQTDNAYARTPARRANVAVELPRVRAKVASGGAFRRLQAHFDIEATRQPPQRRVE